MSDEGCGLFVFPVRRRLTAVALAYLAGVSSAIVFAPGQTVTWMLCVVFLFAGALCLRAGKTALFSLALAALFAGNSMAGAAISLRDQPTQPYTAMSGIVESIEGDFRVRLRDVRLEDGTRLHRPAVVTLMREEEQATPPAPKIGQEVAGVGRLFAQDEVRNPGGMDGRLRAITRGYELSGYLLPGWAAQGEARFSLREMFRQLRGGLLERINALFGDQAALFAAVMLGERDELDAQMSAAMRLTGTAHLLSVSGMHLSMISTAVYTLLRRLPFSRKTAQLIRIAVLVFFTGLTDCAVGTVRALIMILLQMYARARGRRYDRLTALAAAALVITLGNPLMAFDGGFRFSFYVVLGIALLQKRIASLPVLGRLCARMPKFGELLVICICAQISAIPMQLLLYGYVPLLSLPMNLAASMLMPLLMSGGWCALALGGVHSALGGAAAGGLGAASAAFESLSLFAASLHGGILRLPSPHPLLLVIAALVMALCGRTIRFGRRRKPALVIAAAAALVFYLPRLNPAVQYVQLDVGQGDASLMRSGRHAVAIDVGPAYSYDLLRYLRHEGLKLDAVILSHLDEDHAGGLDVLLASEIAVPRVIIAEDAKQYVTSEKVAQAIEKAEQAGRVQVVSAGTCLELEAFSFDVLSPDSDLRGSNERSLLLLARAAEKTLLLTGDLPIDAEPDVIVDCDVLKVAHHGSKNATSREFVQMAQPEIALISVGQSNSYGHPHARVLEDLEKVGAKVLRTDRCGCITVVLDEEPPAVRTMLGGCRQENDEMNAN